MRDDLIIRQRMSDTSKAERAKTANFFSRVLVFPFGLVIVLVCLLLVSRLGVPDLDMDEKPRE